MSENQTPENFYRDVLQLAARVHQVVREGGVIYQELKGPTYVGARISKSWRGKIKIILEPK